MGVNSASLKPHTNNSSFSSGTEAGLDIEREVSRLMGVQSTVDFISDVGGHKTRWPVVFLASLLVVCLIGCSASRILFDRTRSSGTTEEQTLVAPGTAERGPEGEALQLTGQNLPNPEGPDRSFAFSLQSEVEAAVEHSPSRSPESPNKPKIAGRESESPIHEEVQELLVAASEAVKRENLESFLALLDQTETSFVKEQELKAKIVFKKFDEIDGTYSDVKIEVVNNDELAVNLHCKVDAAFARSGRRIVLFDGKQNFTLRRAAGTDWKICAID